jgi:hypothetical protein
MYVHSDSEGDNENIIVQSEIDLRNEWDKNYKWDENKKKFNSGGKRVSSLITDTSASQIKKGKKKKRS